MNLIFRLLAICTTFLFDRRKMNVLDTSIINSRVWPLDLDTNLHMNNGRYLSIMDLGRLDLIVRSNIIGHAIKNRWSPVLSAAIIRYRLPLDAFQKFRLETRLAWWDEKWFYIEHRFVIIGGDKDGVVAAIAFVKGSLYSKANKSTVPTRKLIDIIGLTDKDTPKQPEIIKSWAHTENEMRDLTKKVM